MASNKRIIFESNKKLSQHYNLFPYPDYPLISSVPKFSTFNLHVPSLFQSIGSLVGAYRPRILLAGCGSFSPYPFALANPLAFIDGVDLSQKNIKWARFRIHFHRVNAATRLIVGDLLDHALFAGPYDFIDTFGVLHHLQSPEEGLKALSARLRPGGLMRVMLYSKSARNQLGALRRALRLLNYSSPAKIVALLHKADKSSRLFKLLEKNADLSTESGVADALFNPRENFIDEPGLRQLVMSDKSLQFVRFLHQGSSRLADLSKTSGGNYIFLLQKKESAHADKIKRDCWTSEKVVLHPLLRCLLNTYARPFLPGTQPAFNHLGPTELPFTSENTALLKLCLTPVPIDRLPVKLRLQLGQLLDQLILLPVLK